MPPSSGRLRTFTREFLRFGIKQAWACVFAGVLLAVIIGTHAWYPIPGLHRYDFLFLFAIALQLILLATRLEDRRDALAIAVFHVVATGMELFKTSDAIGAWRYPGEAVIRLGNVPLFAGFMYSAVGSYISRVWHLFDFRFSHFPPMGAMGLVSLLIYLNFFTHHFVVDLRYPLLVAIVIVFARTWIHYRIDRVHRRMPILLAQFLTACFVWLAENIATYCHVWFYPSQVHGWTPVSPHKIVAWFLLMFLSFTLIAAIRRISPPDPPNPPGAP